MKIYLDHYATNEPVTDAKIEVEAGSAKGMALPQPDGTYSFKSEVLDKPGTLSVSFVVLTAKDSDLLAGDLTTALNALGEIIGESVGDDLLDLIFSRFCIGK